MTISQIKYFITVAKCLSFTKAAEQLFLTQPALSRHISKMEEELNVQLFVRTGSGIRLTPAGSSLYLGMTELYEQYQEQVRKARKIQEGLSGSLTIGFLNNMNLADFMPLVYHGLKQKYPNIDILPLRGSFEDLISGLYSGKYDLIFTIQFEVQNKESLLYQYVHRAKDFIVMSRFHPLAQKETVTIDDLKNELFVMISPEDNPESANLIHEICREHGFVPAAKYARTMEEQALWIEAGMGVTILDSNCTLRMNPDIKFYEFDSHWDPSMVVCWNQQNYNPMIEVFIKKMNEVLDLEDEDLHGLAMKAE